MLCLHFSFLCVTACDVQVCYIYQTTYWYIRTCVLLALQDSHTLEHSISLVPAPLQHPKPAMPGMIPEEEEEKSPSPTKKIRKLQNDEEEVCEDKL